MEHNKSYKLIELVTAFLPALTYMDFCLYVGSEEKLDINIAFFNNKYYINKDDDEDELSFGDSKGLLEHLLQYEHHTIKEVAIIDDRDTLQLYCARSESE